MNNRRGFTLIEMLTAFALLFCISIGLTYLLKNGKSAILSAAKQRQAVYAAQSMLEKLEEAPFADLSSFNELFFSDGSGKVMINPVATNLVQITLELKWSANKKPLRLTTLRSSL